MRPHRSRPEAPAASPIPVAYLMHVLGRVLPEDAVVVNESLSSGRAPQARPNAPPRLVLRRRSSSSAAAWGSACRAQ